MTHLKKSHLALQRLQVSQIQFQQHEMYLSPENCIALESSLRALFQAVQGTEAERFVCSQITILSTAVVSYHNREQENSRQRTWISTELAALIDQTNTFIQRQREQPVKVVLGGLCPHVCADLRTVLEQANFQVIEAMVPEQILEMVQIECPDVVLLDGEQAVGDPLQLCRELRQIARGCAIIVIAPFVQEEHLFQFLRHGVQACVPTTITGNLLIETIQRVSEGEHLLDDCTLFQPFVVDAAIQEVEEAREQPPKETTVAFLMTQREVEILSLMSKGQGNKQVAFSLRISEQTVKNHMTTILKKFQVSDRTAAVVLAMQCGIIPQDDCSRDGLEETGTNNETSHVVPSLVALIAQQRGEASVAQEVTSREKMVLLHIMKGEPNKLIGKALNIREMTVKNHITSILKKLQAFDRTHAVVIALNRGIISLEEDFTGDQILSEEKFARQYQQIVEERLMVG